MDQSKMKFLSGDEALAQGVYETGVNVACAYPGTPSTEVLEYLAQFPNVDCQWSVNEKVAFEVAMGASIGGARSLYASKHVGINVAMDPLMTAAYTGVNGGFVIVIADDPGLHSSQNEQDTRQFARIAKVPLLEPSSPAEAYTFAKAAFEISEQFDIPVIIRITTRVAHTKENVVVGERVDVPVKPFTINPQKYVMVPGHAYRRHIELEKRLLLVQEYVEKSKFNRIEKGGPVGIIADSVSYLYAKEMFPDASFLKLGFTWPFPDQLIRQFAASVKEVHVVEELEPFIEEHVQSLGITVKPRHPSYLIGELRPELIPGLMAGEAKVEVPAKTRKPVMCPGCSHRPVFHTLKKLKLTVAGDIGCYTLGALPPLSALHTCHDMGASITFFDGLKRAQKDMNFVAIIGDSTFVHSGITGLVNAAYNKAKGLIIIQDNGTTAMTGSQHNPATGYTITNEKTKRLNLEEICKAAGADNVDVADPFDTKALEALIKKRVAENALSVIITRFPCRILERNAAPHMSIDQGKCKKCGACLQIDCPAISKSETGEISVNPQFCVGCGLCVTVCAFGAVKIHE